MESQKLHCTGKYVKKHIQISLSLVFQKVFNDRAARKKKVKKEIKENMSFLSLAIDLKDCVYSPRLVIQLSYKKQPPPPTSVLWAFMIVVAQPSCKKISRTEPVVGKKTFSQCLMWLAAQNALISQKPKISTTTTRGKKDERMPICNWNSKCCHCLNNNDQ